MIVVLVDSDDRPTKIYNEKNRRRLDRTKSNSSFKRVRYDPNLMNDSIATRREKIAYYLRNGMNEIKISETLGVSRQTVVRDVSYMKNNSRYWLDGLAKDGFIFEYKLGLDSIKESISKLEKLYNERNDTESKIKLLREKREHIKTYLELLSETPTVHALRKVREITDVQST